MLYLQNVHEFVPIQRASYTFGIVCSTLLLVILQHLACFLHLPLHCLLNMCQIIQDHSCLQLELTANPGTSKTLKLVWQLRVRAQKNCKLTANFLCISNRVQTLKSTFEQTLIVGREVSCIQNCVVYKQKLCGTIMKISRALTSEASYQLKNQPRNTYLSDW